MQEIKVGILGLGTVGCGTADVLARNAAEITRKTGIPICVTMACVRDKNKTRECDSDTFSITTEPMDVVTSPNVDIVVELIGGTELARDLVSAAITNGKHVVTANKALIALHGNELFRLAENAGVQMAYEAAVAGGISIIKSIREGFAGNQIEAIAGIINGTGNFILTEMRDKGRTFEDVLAEAQELGYAEADPTFDVEGIDAAHKLTILAAIAFGTPLQFEEVYTEGISKLELIDVDYAKELGYRIKHLGIAKKIDGDLELRVHPTLIPEQRLIANVNGVMNAVLVKGDAVGNTLHYGAGAGADPTASAVVADIIDVARIMSIGARSYVPGSGFTAAAIKNLPVRKQAEFECAFYLRFEVEDVPGVMSQLSAVFAEQNISIEGITQKEPKKGDNSVSVIFITQKTVERSVDEALEALKTSKILQGSVAKIRVEHLD
ncbi:MAG: homoserine dehydrogenase [Gammaproteobacteria bacterium]|nr:homoserine dehydrogenase [Gammaproteobacteria bacterium]